MSYFSALCSIVEQHRQPFLSDTLNHIDEESYQELALEKLSDMSPDKQATILAAIYRNYIRSKLSNTDVDIHYLPEQFQADVDVYKSIMNYFLLDIQEDIEDHMSANYDKEELKPFLKGGI